MHRVRVAASLTLAFGGIVPMLAHAQSNADIAPRSADARDIDKSRGGSRFDIAMSIERTGVVHVREAIHLERTSSPRPPLTRHLWLERDTFLSRQRVANVSVTDSVGQRLEFRTRTYGDFFNIDLLEIPPDEIAQGTGRALIIEYQIVHGLRVHGDRARLDWYVLGLFWNLPTTGIRVQVRFPEPVSSTALTQQFKLDEQAIPNEHRPAIAISNDVMSWQYDRAIAPERALSWSLTFPRMGIAAPTLRQRIEQVWRRAGFLFMWLLGLLAAVPFLMFARPRVAVGFTRVWNLLAIGVAAYAIGKHSLYWLHEGTYRGVWADALLTVAADLGLIGGLLAYLIVQERWLRDGVRAAYVTQFALPVILAIPVPMYTTNLTLLFLPLLGLPVAVYWFRRDIALHFGVGTRPLVETVSARGTLDVDVLKTALNDAGELSLDELARLLDAPFEEAAEVARHVSASGAIDAVYDRAGARLVQRALYRDMAKDGSCDACGGLVGVVDGQVTCPFCGQVAANA